MMNNTALLVIDVQLGIFMRKHHDGMAIYQEEALIRNIQTLIHKAREAHSLVIFTQHMYINFPLMDKGQPMWEVHPDIKPGLDDIVIEKYHADAFYESTLDETLKSHAITNLVITGLETAYCVDTTCRRAYSLGYKNIMVSDGHSTLDSDILTAEQIVAHHNSILGSQFADLAATDVIEFNSK